MSDYVGLHVHRISFAFRALAINLAASSDPIRHPAFALRSPRNDPGQVQELNLAVIVVDDPWLTRSHTLKIHLN